MILNRPEKRNYQRLDVEIDVDLVIEGKHLSATSSNVSCGGMFIPTKDNYLKERTDIEITLHLPEEKKQVRIIGAVARMQDSSFLGSQKKGVAIEFRGLYDDNILAIDRFIKNKIH